LHYVVWIGHEVFHAWNHDTIRRASDKELWFAEGITEYYGHRFAGETAYRLWMEEHWRFYKNDILPTACNISIEELGINFQKQSEECPRYYYCVYQKGALLGYMIDKKLIEEGLNLDDLMRYLYLNNGLLYEPTSSDDVLAALNTISNQDWNEFFEKYIYGIEPLPLDGQFELLNH
jgi:predicted metalloprotease with PDZ domain